MKGMSLIVLGIIFGTFIHAAPIPKQPVKPFPVINIYNSSNIKVYFTNYNSSSSIGKDGTQQYPNVQESLLRFQTYLKTSEAKLQQLIDLINGTRNDILQMKNFINTTNTQLINEGIDPRKLNTSKIRNLAIFFYPDQFKTKPPHKVQGKWGSEDFIFVNKSGLGASPTFLEVKEVLNSFFLNAWRIRRIHQNNGYSKNGRKVVMVTSVDGSISGDSKHWNYCNADGGRYAESELKSTSGEDLRENDGKRFIIRDDGCRTVLTIRIE